MTKDYSVKFFADTADLKEIDFCFRNGVNDGITTNPKIMEAAGVTNFETTCRNILNAYPNVPVSLETDLRGIQILELEQKVDEVTESLIKQARMIYSLGGNAVVKIPYCTGGLNATKILHDSGIKTNVTACMNPHQALTASNFGATYVSLFANRMVDSYIFEMAGHDISEIVPGNVSWKEIVKANRDLTQEAWRRTLVDIANVADKLRKNQSSELIVGSIRSPEDIEKILDARPQIITLPTTIVQKLGDINHLKYQEKASKYKGIQSKTNSAHNHPMTLFTLDEFEKAADKYRDTK